MTLSVGKVYLVASSPESTLELALDAGTAWTIGRSADNALVCNDKSMSRRHGMIQQMQPGKYYFIDLGSSNGSSLNGRRITIPIELRDQDCIVCGATRLTFHDHSKGAGASQANESDGATMVLYARRTITVLVVDIRDFTPLTRQLNDAVLAQTIGTWFRHAGMILRRYGASGDKYIGDAVMAVWTHATETPTSAEICDILKALSEIEAFTRTLHQQFPLPAALRVGAGVNTGISIMSNTGPQENPDFSPLGDAVNAGFRLETATKKAGFDVALGRATAEALNRSGTFAAHFQKKSVELKGYDEAVEAWFTTFDTLKDYLAAVALDRSHRTSPQ